jgi:hypothetical protein
LFGTDARDQYTVEAYYRLQLAEHLENTSDIQLIKDPALNPGEDFVWVAGGCARVLLFDDACASRTSTGNNATWSHRLGKCILAANPAKAFLKCFQVGITLAFTPLPLCVSADVFQVILSPRGDPESGHQASLSRSLMSVSIVKLSMN